MPLDLQSDSHRTWPEVLLGCRDGSIQGDGGTEVRVCGRLKWARLYILMKTTTLASVYLQTPIKSWMRPPSARQRKWWGKLVSCCIHCSLLPTSFSNTPHPHTPPHPKSRELSIMNGALWYVSVTAVNVFTSIWSVGEAANWVSVFPGHQEVSLSINTESLQRLLQMLFPTGFQVVSDLLQAVGVINWV